MFTPLDVLKQKGEFFLLVGVILLVALLAKSFLGQWLGRLQGRSTPSTPQSLIPAGITLKKRKILSRGEMAFYHALKAAVRDRYDIYAQIPVWALVDVAGENDKERCSFKNQINLKRVDFVLLNPTTLETDTVIELDDRSHQQDKTQERDTFVNAVLARAGIPIIRIAAAMTYNEGELRKKFVTMEDAMPAKP